MLVLFIWAPLFLCIYRLQTWKLDTQKEHKRSWQIASCISLAAEAPGQQYVGSRLPPTVLGILSNRILYFTEYKKNCWKDLNCHLLCALPKTYWQFFLSFLKTKMTCPPFLLTFISVRFYFLSWKAEVKSAAHICKSQNLESWSRSTAMNLSQPGLHNDL